LRFNGSTVPTTQRGEAIWVISGIGVSSKNGFFGAQKKLKKSQKKACQLLTHSLKRVVDATNRPERPFKKTLKKVKKKLVSAAEI
jgi:hypothetical protein